jgi:negative regulator of flagellin synthesis FlgM
MNNININKTNEIEPIQTRKQSDVSLADIKKSESDAPRNVVREDKFQISDRASEVGKFVDRIKDLPDIRQEKVDVLRQQIESGEYDSSSEDIADAVLKEIR